MIGGAGVLAEAGEAELSGDDDFYELTPVELVSCVTQNKKLDSKNYCFKNWISLIKLRSK